MSLVGPLATAATATMVATVDSSGRRGGSGGGRSGRIVDRKVRVTVTVIIIVRLCSFYFLLWSLFLANVERLNEFTEDLCLPATGASSSASRAPDHNWPSLLLNPRNAPPFNARRLLASTSRCRVPCHTDPLLRRGRSPGRSRARGAPGPAAGEDAAPEAVTGWFFLLLIP